MPSSSLWGYDSPLNVDYLDVKLNLCDLSYIPYKKQNAKKK